LFWLTTWCYNIDKYFCRRTTRSYFFHARLNSSRIRSPLNVYNCYTGNQTFVVHTPSDPKTVRDRDFVRDDDYAHSIFLIDIELIRNDCTIARVDKRQSKYPERSGARVYFKMWSHSSGKHVRTHETSELYTANRNRLVYGREFFIKISVPARFETT